VSRLSSRSRTVAVIFTIFFTALNQRSDSAEDTQVCQGLAGGDHAAGWPTNVWTVVGDGGELGGGGGTAGVSHGSAHGYGQVTPCCVPIAAAQSSGSG